MSEDWFAGVGGGQEDATSSSEDWFATPTESPLADRARELQAQIAKEQAAAEAGTPISTVGDPEKIPEGLGALWKSGRLGMAGSLAYGVPAAITDLQAAALKSIGAPDRVVAAAEKVAAEKKVDWETARMIPGMVSQPPKNLLEKTVQAAPGTLVAQLGFAMPGVGPVVGGIMAGAPAFAGNYNEAVDRGENRAKAGGLALFNGVAQGLIERMGGTEAALTKEAAAKGAKEYFLDLAKESGLKRFAKRVAESTGTEIGENVLQTVLDLNTRWALNEFKGKSGFEIAKTYLSELKDAIGTAAIMTPATVAPVHAGHGMVEQAVISQLQQEGLVPQKPSTRTTDAMREVAAVRAEADRVNYEARIPAIDLMTRLNAAQDESDRLEQEYRKREGFLDETIPMGINDETVARAIRPWGKRNFAKYNALGRNPVVEQGGEQRMEATNPGSELPLSGVANEGAPPTLTNGGVLDTTGTLDFGHPSGLGGISPWGDTSVVEPQDESTANDLYGAKEVAANAEAGVGIVKATRQDALAQVEGYIPEAVQRDIEAAREQIRRNKAAEMVGEDAGKAVAAGIDPSVSLADAHPDPDGASRMVDGSVDYLETTMDGWANEREHTATSDEAAAYAEAIFGNDPSVAKPEDLAKQRSAATDYVASLRAKLMEAMRTIYGHATAASTVVQTREQAIDAIKALRQVALAEALKLGDPKMFDRADADYRYILDGLTSQQGPNQPLPSTTPPRSMADAVSEYRDAVVTALPKVEKQYGRKWEKLAKKGELPNDPNTGGPISKELFVRGGIIGFQSDANKIFTDISQMTDDNQRMKEADRRLATLLKQYRISPNSVGFRGNSSLILNSEMNTAVEEIRSLLHGTSAAKDPSIRPSLTMLSEEELAALARTYVDNQAKIGNLPNVGVLQFIQNELSRRAGNIPPQDVSPLSNTDEVNAQIKSGLGADLSPETYKAITGEVVSPKETARATVWDRLANIFPRFTATALGQGFSGLGVRPNWASPHFGPSMTTMLAPLASFKQKVITAKLMSNLKRFSNTLRDSIMQDAARVGAVLDDGIAAYIKDQRDQGLYLDKGLFYVSLGDAVTSGQLDQIPEQIRPLIQNEVLPFLAQFQKKVAEYATSPELKAKIFDSMNRYLYRDYAAFRDEDVFFKDVVRFHPKFTEAVDTLLADSSKKMFDELYRAKAPELRNQGKTEEEIVKTVDMLVRPHAEALVEGQLRSHLKNPYGRPNSFQWLQRARLDYFKKRVLSDPAMRELLGEERHFGYAFQHTIGLMANDIARYQFNEGLVDILRKQGLLGDMVEGLRTEPISKDNLVPVRNDSPFHPSGDYYYGTKEVSAVMDAWSRGADQSSRTINNAISYMKSLMILAPAGVLQNIESIPQTVLTAVGFTKAIGRIINSSLPGDTGSRTRAENILAWRAMREFLTPGKSVGKLKAEATRGVSAQDAQMMAETGAWLDQQLDSIGMTSRQFYGLVSELQQAGLDTGGEYAFELGKGAEPAFLDYKGRPQANVFRKAIRSAGEIYRSADVLSKVITYQEEIRQLRWKAGYDAESYRDVPIDGADDGLRRKAAERALRLTQNPETTPDAIRNLSRGALGLATFNFGGFFYQMARNYAWAHIYGAQDIIAGQMLHGNAERMREAGDLQGAARASNLADRHLRMGTDRMVGAAASMAMFTAAVKFAAKSAYGLFNDGEDDEDRKQHIAYFRPYISNRYEDFQTLKYWKGHDGRYYALVLPTGRTDIYDGMKQYVRVMSDPNLSPVDRVKAASTIFRDQYASASAIVSGLYLMATKDDAADKAAVVMDSMLGQGPRFAYRLITDSKSLAEEPYRHPSLPQPVGLEKKPLADIVYQVSRQLGIPIKVERVTDNLVSRYKQTWAENLSWLKGVSDKYNVATKTQRLKLIADNKEQWDKMLTTFDTHRNHAFGTSHDSSMLLKLLSDETQIPKEISYELVYGTAETTRPSLEAYLDAKSNQFTTKLTSE